MKKVLKKMIVSMMSLFMFLGIFNNLNAVYADDSTPSVVSNLKVDKSIFKSEINGTITLNSVRLESITRESVSEDENIINGTITSSIKAGDLFKGAYDLYDKEFKGKKDYLGRYWENIVMFDKDSKFPTAQYVLEFPSNVTVDQKLISLNENSDAISSINYSYNNNKLIVTLNLGNWNDYKGFFNLVKNDLGDDTHMININIPFSVKYRSSSDLGVIKGHGSCELYKCSGLIKGKIVNIKVNENTFDLSDLIK